MCTLVIFVWLIIITNNKSRCWWIRPLVLVLIILLPQSCLFLVIQLEICVLQDPDFSFLHHWIILLYHSCTFYLMSNLLYYWLIFWYFYGYLGPVAMTYGGHNLVVPSEIYEPLGWKGRSLHVESYSRRCCGIFE